MKNIVKMLAITSYLALNSNLAIAQKDSAGASTNKPSPLTTSIFVEVYYCYDFNQPSNNTLPDFVSTFNKHNEIAINLAYIKESYNTDRVRANLALGLGTYMNASYAAEPGVLKNIYEADAGIKLSEKKSIWLDAGVMPSHIGFESSYSPDCWNLTRSIMADNSPYYETGARLSYTSDNSKWYAAALVLNGWQRIERPDGNSTFSGGTQITYNPTNKVTLNYSTFVGNDKPDSVKKERIYHDFYGIYQITKKFSVITGIDYGIEQKFTGSADWNDVLGLALILRYKATSKSTIAVRAEHYMDKNGVLIVTSTPNGFNTTGVSANFDYHIMSNVLLRIEYKYLNSEDDIFTDKNGKTLNTDMFATTSLCVTF